MDYMALFEYHTIKDRFIVDVSSLLHHRHFIIALSRYRSHALPLHRHRAIVALLHSPKRQWCNGAIVNYMALCYPIP